MAAGLGEGRGTGRPHGPPFNDGDFLKWFEALVQVYAITKDPKLDQWMDEMIGVIAKAQREDGYLHTQKIIPQRRGLTGTFAREFIMENQTGRAVMTSLRRQHEELQIEKVGKELRGMMSWIKR
jgi:DUF1680 family protein